MATGMEPGEHALFVGFDDPRWLFFDQGFVFAAGQVPNGTRDREWAYARQQIERCRSSIVLVERVAQWASIVDAGPLASVGSVVVLGSAVEGAMDDDRFVPWADFVSAAADVSEADLRARFDELEDIGQATRKGTRDVPATPRRGERTEVMRQLARLR